MKMTIFVTSFGAHTREFKLASNTTIGALKAIIASEQPTVEEYQHISQGGRLLDDGEYIGSFKNREFRYAVHPPREDVLAARATPAIPEDPTIPETPQAGQPELTAHTVYGLRLFSTLRGFVRARPEDPRLHTQAPVLTEVEFTELMDDDDWLGLTK